MPTYTYRCQKCGVEFERFQSMSDEPVKRCERCRGKVQRVFHPVGIVLKGPGFHKTDYRSSGSKTSSSDAGSSESSSDSKKSESKTSETKSSDKKSAPSSGKASASDS